MIEITILNYLKSNGFDVYMERPTNPTAPYVLLEKTGSSRTNFITTSTFAVQSCADSMAAAARLNTQVKQIMDEADTLTGVSASKLISDYNFTNMATKQFRYQAEYEVTHKE